MHVVNTYTVKVTNRGFTGQGKTKKQGGKSSESIPRFRASVLCFRCGAVGHWKSECSGARELEIGYIYDMEKYYIQQGNGQNRKRYNYYPCL